MGRTIKSSEIKFASRSKAEIESVIVVRSALHPHKINDLKGHAKRIVEDSDWMIVPWERHWWIPLSQWWGVEPTMSVLESKFNTITSNAIGVDPMLAAVVEKFEKSFEELFSPSWFIPSCTVLWDDNIKVWTRILSLGIYIDNSYSADDIWLSFDSHVSRSNKFGNCAHSVNGSLNRDHIEMTEVEPLQGILKQRKITMAIYFRAEAGHIYQR